MNFRTVRSERLIGRFERGKARGSSLGQCMEGYDDRPPPMHRPRRYRRGCCWWSRMCCELMCEFSFHLIFLASVTPTWPLFSTVTRISLPPHEDDNDHIEQHCSIINIIIVNELGAVVSTVHPLLHCINFPLPYFSPSAMPTKVNRRSARKRNDADDNNHDDDEISCPRVRQRNNQMPQPKGMALRLRSLHLLL